MKNTKQLLYVYANCKRQANSEADNCTFKLCSGCHRVHYCNRECQLADRRIHKVACKAVQANDSNSATTILNVDNLFDCCRKGDLIGVKQEISQCTDLNAMLNLGWLICTLIRSRCYECTELLLQHNANPNVRDISGLVPLHVACIEGYEEFVSLLLKYKADPNIFYSNGYSNLHFACENGYDKCVSLLLQYNVDPNIVDKDGSTPLHRACGKGEDKCALLLLQAEANMECIDKNSGFTSLQGACYHGHLKCVALLVEHGANIHIRSIPYQQSVLFASCISGNINLVTYILSLGVDANAPDSRGITPIQHCYAYGLDKYVKLLIEHGADESSMKKPFPANLLKDDDLIKNEHVRTKELRQKAKHCDYPDCCNGGNDCQSLHACSSCRAVYYCSREHQEAHWKGHKKLCKAIKK